MRRLIAALAALAALAFAGSAQASLIPAHSHWDIRNANHELQVCYTIIGHTTGEGSTIAFVPLREKDSQNFMQLTITTTGFKLLRRVAGTFYTVTPSVATPISHGADGQEIMFDFVEQGGDFYLYALNPDLTRGPLQYQWHDSTYLVGVNISYYTSPHWAGQWDFVHGHPLDSVGMPHEISKLTQDARNHSSVTGAATFDDPTPASGSVTGITNKDVSTVNVGLASGTNYTYTFTVKTGTGSDTGYVDYRDPGDSSNEKFFQHSWYRLKVSATKTTIQRYVGTTAGQVWTASQGGYGSYKLVLQGSDQVLYKGATQVLHVNDGGPASGLRLRFVPSSQSWDFTGTTVATTHTEAETGAFE